MRASGWKYGSLFHVLVIAGVVCSAALALPISPAAAQPPDRNRGRSAWFVEDPSRLPASLANEAPGTSSTGINLADFDRDGDLDIFLAEGTAGLDGRPNILLINDGRGFFKDESATRLPVAPFVNSTKAAVGDFDRDGDLDLVVANLGPEQLLLNDGHGHFSDASAQLPPPPDLFSDISPDVHVADVNGDRCMDILVANENPFDPSPTHGAQNRLWLNDCHAHFVDVTAARLPAATDQTGVMLSGDLDRDGDLDIVVLNRGQDFVWINVGRGFFADATSDRFPVTTDTSRSGALADMNGDGSLDLVVSNSRGEVPRLYLNDGNGFFRDEPIPYVEADGETDTALALVDLNGDRFPDVYIGNAGRFDSGHGFEGGPDHFFENSRGHLREATASHAVFPADQASTAAAFGDLDGDGDADLVVGGTGDGALGRERIFMRRDHRGPHCER
jgi:hypothetical protein